MSKSRRQFLKKSSLALLGAVTGCRSKPRSPAEQPAGAPPAFGTAPAVGPEVSPSTFAAAEKLVQVDLTSAELDLAARSWRSNMAGLYEQRTGPRKLVLEPAVAPWSRCDPVPPGERAGPQRDRFLMSKTDPGPLPAKDDEGGPAPYHVVHAPGVTTFTHERAGIASELSLSVPREDPVKIALQPRIKSAFDA